MPVKLTESLEELCEYCHLLYRKNLICSTGGNVSLRIGEQVLITPTGATLGILKPSDVVTIRLDTGEVIGNGRPSKELGFHLGMFRAHPELRGIIHVHPTASLAFSARHPESKLNAVPATNAGFYVRSGQIPMLPYFLSGSQPLHEAVNHLAVDFTTIMLGLHGLIVGRKTLLEAFNATEEIEQNCEIYLLAGEEAQFLTKEQCITIDQALNRTWPTSEKYSAFFKKFQN